MDDFYADMRDTLDILSEEQKKVYPEFSIPPQDSGILAYYFPNLFQLAGLYS